jgi:hypothetical protein
MHPENYKRMSRNWEPVRTRHAPEDCFNKGIVGFNLNWLSVADTLSLLFLLLFGRDST